jgi:hypothetical protein
LLFLARAADPPRVFTPSERPTVTEGDEARPDGSPPEPEPGATDGRDPAVVELHRAYLGKPPIALLDLVKALDQPLPDVRRRANELLRLLLGDERVGRADRHPLVRGRLALWIRKNARFLERDGDRFVLRDD